MRSCPLTLAWTLTCHLFSIHIQENNVFYGHHAKIVCLAWSPDNEHFASGGMDMMVYVWTLSDPETRVKIQGDAPTHLGSLSSSGEASPGPEGPFCALGEVAPSGGLAIQQTSLLVQADVQRTPVCPASIQQPCPSRVDLGSPVPMSPPSTTSCGLWSLSIQSLPHREPFMLNINGILYYSKKLCQVGEGPPPVSGPTLTPHQKLFLRWGGRAPVGCPQVCRQVHSLVQDGGGEQSRLRWAILVSTGSSAGFVGRLKFKMQQGALRVEGGKSSP